MVCARCKMVVKSELDKLGLQTISVELGEVEINEEINENQKEVLLKNLQSIGFDLLDDKKTKTIEKINSTCNFPERICFRVF